MICNCISVVQDKINELQRSDANKIIVSGFSVQVEAHFEGSNQVVKMDVAYYGFCPFCGNIAGDELLNVSGHEGI